MLLYRGVVGGVAHVAGWRSYGSAADGACSCSWMLLYRGVVSGWCHGAGVMALLTSWLALLSVVGGAAHVAGWCSYDGVVDGVACYLLVSSLFFR